VQQDRKRHSSRERNCESSRENPKGCEHRREGGRPRTERSSASPHSWRGKGDRDLKNNVRKRIGRRKKIKPKGKEKGKKDRIGLNVRTRASTRGRSQDLGGERRGRGKSQDVRDSAGRSKEAQAGEKDAGSPGGASYTTDGSSGKVGGRRRKGEESKKADEGRPYGKGSRTSS